MNLKRQRFVDAYLTIAAGNATKAAELAGYSKRSAKVNGSRLLTFADVRQAIDAQAAALALKTEATADRIISEVSEVAFTKIDVKGGDKLKALELLGRYRKLWQDKGADASSRITVNIGFLSTEPQALPAITVSHIETPTNSTKE